MLKRIRKWVAGMFGVLVLLLAGGGVWYVTVVKSHLTPPPNPAGQQSIASYAAPESVDPIQTPRLVEGFSWDAIAQPPKSARAWTRWWWPGGDVETTTLLEQLDELDAAQFGGAEVQPFISGVMALGDNDAVMARVYSFDTPSYYDKLRAVIAGAAQRGLQIDLTHFSGWPPGGPEINLEDSLTDIAYGQTEISGGTSVTVTLPKPKAGPSEYILQNIELAGADFVNFPVERVRVLSVLAAKRVSGKHSWNPFNLDDTEALDPLSIQVVTPFVKDGVLTWNAPAGDWQIIASYIMPSGEAPIGAAQKPQGFVVDHLRTPQVIGHYEYAFGARTGLPALYGKGLRGFFNDSLEFRLKRMGVEDILSEFTSRRGYDLEPNLPVIYIEGVDNVYFRDIMGIHAAPEFQLTPLDDRIRHDYQQTLSDLVIERFVHTSARWAEARGLVSRAQSYGMEIDILRALGANTIPETEQLWAGGSDLGLKMASSAAALYGKPLVSAESFVWINRDFTTTARKLKAATDKMLLAGVNHIVYHGTPYPWHGTEPSPFGQEGWTPFSAPENPAHFSSIVGPGNTSLWPDVPAVNRYIARCQNLLRQGTPSVDVLIYYPFLGFTGSNPTGVKREALLNGSIPDADSQHAAAEASQLTAGRRMLDRLMHVPALHDDARVQWANRLLPLLHELDRRGMTWSWVNGDALQSGRVGAGVLTASNGRYQAIVLLNVKRIEQATLRSLGTLAAEGVPVVFAGELPSQQPGFNKAAEGDREVVELVQQVLGSGARQTAFDAVELAAALQTQAQPAFEYGHATTIKNYRRDLGGGNFIYFFANQDAGAAAVTLQTTSSKPMWWFDAAQGVAWPVQRGDSGIELQLSGFDSRFLIVGVPMPMALVPQLPDSIVFARAGKRWNLNEWGFMSGNYARTFTTLQDWRDIAELQHARGPGVYTRQLALEGKLAGARYLLNLGLVQGTASVRVNGQEIGRASMPPFIVDVTAALQQGNNIIDVVVSAPLRNEFVGRALADDPKYSQMKGFANQLAAAGLMGPVVLAETMPEAMAIAR